MTTAVQNEQEQKVIDGVRKQLYIGGDWRDGAEGATLPVEDPSTGETLCDVGDAEDRPRGRRRLHDGDETGVADAAVDARPGADPRGGRAAGRRAERHHLVVVRVGYGALDPGPAHAEAVIHRFDRGRAEADRA